MDNKPPGPIVLFGSGETSPSGQKTFDSLFRLLTPSPNVDLLETPAGFEVNSELVIQRVADFLAHHLQNYQPEIRVVPARKRDTAFSPDDPTIASSLLESDLIFLGPGSPTYAVRQLKDSLAWQYTIARHYLGAAIVLASAATIAAGAYSLPVYEIYKVGEDLHWKKGLDLFGLYGMSLVFIPHWNNNEGGQEYDSSRCFMGRERFNRLLELIPADTTVLGIDEHTALIIDLQSQVCMEVGNGEVTLLHKNHPNRKSDNSGDLEALGLNDIDRQRNAHVHQYRGGQTFPLSDWFPIQIPKPGTGIPQEVWSLALETNRVSETQDYPPEEVLVLSQVRQTAREGEDWANADAIRDQIMALGWEVKDTSGGPELIRRKP